jgi:chromosome transmission fidelity protein 18
MDEADFMESFDDDLALEAELEAELQAESAAALAVDDEDIPEEFDATSTMRPVEVRQQRQAVVPMEEERAPIAEASAPASAMEQEEQELEEATAPQHDREVVRTFSVSLENGRELPLCLLAPRDHSHFAAARTGNLLSQPISVLRDTLDRQASAAERAATQASERLFALGDADLKEVVPDSAGCTAPPPSQLWVDKYAPQRFMELLSDERVNRQVLAWIKGWDEHVFRGQPSTAKSVGAKAAAAAASAARARGEFGAKRSTRPEKQLLLLSGPPGMGKTTLAHVVAKHAGYRPVEINASDERSAKVLKQRIAEATDMQSVFSDHRPPLIILDEIDGAMGGSEGTSAIHELLKLANMTARQSKGITDDADGEGGAKGGKGSKGLQRPVICICNDVYAPALRPLRAVAECIEFRAASNSQLLTRLKHVCRVEKLHAEPSMLDALAQLAHQDVRTCLNTLQFVRGRSSTLSEAVLASVGAKSMAKSPLALWKQVFSATPPKRVGPDGAAAAGGGGPGGGAWEAARSAGSSRAAQAKAAAAAKTVTSAATLFADLERADVARVLEGVHENYLNVSYTDPQLLRTAEAAEALSVLDLRTQAAYSKGHFALEAYASAAVVEVHMACAVPHLREKISFPKAGREQQKRCEQQQAIVRGWQGGMSPALHAAYPRTALIVDVLSPLLTILTPPIKPGATHLLASDERRVLGSLVDVMLAFGLSYQQRSTDEGGYAYRLEPPLAELLPSIEPLHEPDAKPAAPSVSAEEGTGAVVGTGYAPGASTSAASRDAAGAAPPVNSGLRRELPAAVKQLLSVELYRETLRRHHGLEKAGGAKEAGGGLGVASPAPLPATRPTLSLKPQPLAPKAAQVAMAPKEKRDMFGRVVPVAKGTKRGAGAVVGTPEEVFPIRFKYQEGVTDAVRRVVRVRDLL